jgi:DNA-binding CsgD family transcriptional regulator
VPTVASLRVTQAHANAGFSHALRSFEDARYTDVVDELSYSRDGESRILLAKTYLRLQDYAAALMCLRQGKFDTPRLQSIAEILMASAAERTGGDDTYALKLPPNASAEILALRDTYAALSAWRASDFTRAADLATRAVATGDHETSIISTDLLGWIALSTGHPEKATSYFLSVLDQIDAGPIRDEHFRINAARALAFTAVKALDLGMLGRIEKEIKTPSISPFTARPYLGALLSASVLQSVAGEDLKQFRTLLTAKALDVPKPFGALADAHLATLHRRDNEIQSARMHLSFAAKALDDVEWAKSDVEERLVGVLFATEAAAQRDRRAGPAFTRAISFEGKQNLAFAFERDRHAHGIAHFARARLSEMRDNAGAAIEDYQQATQIFEEHGDRYRWSLASLEILRLEQGTRIPKALRAQLCDLPSNSSLWREANRLTSSAASPLAQLTPAERRVFEKLCEGMTSQQIAEDLGRSTSTIRNQTISIFRKFDVSTRAALVAQARKIA